MIVKPRTIRINYSYDRVPTIRNFSQSEKRIRGILGPFGSGKSSGCLMEILKRAHMQRPGKDGIRHTRWAVVRNTYSQLSDTTIKTVFHWLPEIYFGTYKSAQHVYTITQFEGCEIELMFRALDRPDHISNLLSLELTGAWINEAREVVKAIIDAMDGRIGRYPAVEDGGCTWKGIIMDTNPPEEDSWWYHMFEDPTSAYHRDDAAIFKQPSGRSPEAENLMSWEEYRQWQELLDSGNPVDMILPGLEPDYYDNLAKGKTQDYIDVYIDAKYGYVKEGRPVYETSWNDNLHVASESLRPIQGRPLIIPCDFGLTPAAVIIQLTPRGFFNVLDELLSDGMGFQQFLKNILKPYLKNKYPDYPVLLVGDPAGTERSQSDEKSCFDIAQEEGFKIVGAKANDLTARINAVESFLSRMTDGMPTFRLDPSCVKLRKGFNGRYHFRRLKTNVEKYDNEPEKNEFSHCFVAGTQIATEFGNKPIENIQIGERVITPYGLRKVLMSCQTQDYATVAEIILSDGNKITGTPNHPFYVHNKKWTRIDALQYNDILECINLQGGINWTIRYLLSSIIENIAFQLETTIGRKIGSWGDHPIYIGLYGNFILVKKYLKVFMSTIKTKILSIMNLPILNSSPIISTCFNMEPVIIKTIQDAERELKPHRMQQKSGINLTRGKNGIENMQKPCGKNINYLQSSVKYAKPQNRLLSLQEPDGVIQNANLKPEECVGTTTFKEFVSFVKALLRQTNILKLKRAPKVVQVNLKAKPKPVYNLTIENNHVYFANGLLVHNCHDALQYGALYFTEDIRREQKRTHKRKRRNYIPATHVGY